MAASLSIELDTTAPTVTLGSPLRIGGVVVVPYTVDEEGVASAEVLSVAAVVDPSRLVSSSEYPSGGVVDVQTVAVDAVGNSRTQSETLYIDPAGQERTRRCRVSVHQSKRTRAAVVASQRCRVSVSPAQRTRVSVNAFQRCRTAVRSAARTRINLENQ